ncbi:MAG TPA: ATP-binding protein [Thermoanaerobaculia bacterium]|nr:ATP-binding protein [Thermoanaerobaculia bacterium]
MSSSLPSGATASQRVEDEALRLLISQVRDFMIVFGDADGRIATWNPGAVQLFGYTEEEVIGEPFATLFTVEDIAAGVPEKELATARATGRAVDRRWHERKDGTRFFADGFTLALRRDGQFWFAKIARDATEEKRTQDRLAELQFISELAHETLSLEELFKSVINHFCRIFECTAGAILLLNEERTHLTVTAALGFEEELSRKLAVPVGVGFAGRIAASNAPLVLRGEEEIQKAVYRTSLRERPLQTLAGVPLRTSHGSIGVLHIGSAHDRPFTQDHLDLLQAAADRIAVAVENARLFTSEQEARARMEFLARATAILSTSLDYEQTLQSLVRLLVPDLADWAAVDVVDARGELKRVGTSHELQPTEEAARQVLATGEPQMRNGSMIVPLRGRERILGTLSTVQAESGRRYSSVDLVFMTELAQRAASAIENATLYSEARAANAARDVFLATLSHEIRTPMTSILGWTQMLRTPDLDEKTRRLGIESITESAQVQARLVDDLLDVSRIIAGKLRLELEPADIKEIAHAAADAVRPNAESAGVRLVVQEPTCVIQPVLADRVRLRQVVSNLLSNAIKFTPPAGLVMLRVECDDHEARITVSDTGRGISPELLPHIFDRFRQAEGMDLPTFGGLGLGLAIVKSLVERHGGRVEAASPGEGKGATFTVHLPVKR